VARREKEGDQGLRPCEDQESGSGCPHIDGTLQKSVGDVWSRISSANALQKERSGPSERGPNSERGSAGEPSAATSSKRTARVELTAKPGEDRRKAQGDERSSSSGSHIAKKRCVSRGTRVVRATGSYEESLSMEGIPDHHEASAFTRRRQRWSRQSPHPPTRTNQPRGGRTVKHAAPTKVGEA
jgi:hypothetical protein